MKEIDNSIKSYVPEILSALDKDVVGTRICTEDCAVIDLSRDLLILQSRGANLLPNTAFPIATGMTEQEKQLLLDALQENTRFLMSVGDRPLLIFADWMQSTGLILAILPHTSTDAAIRALLMMQRNDIVILDQGLCRASSADCREARTLLTDLLRYTDSILSQHLPTPHFLLVLSAFSGCKLEIESKFLQELPKAPVGDRLTSLLFCCFLYIRSIAGTASQSDVIPCRLSIAYRFPTPNGYKPPIPAFLSAPCFSDIGSLQEEGRFSFSLSAHTELAATAYARSLYIVLEILPTQE